MPVAPAWSAGCAARPVGKDRRPDAAAVAEVVVRVGVELLTGPARDLGDVVE